MLTQCNEIQEMDPRICEQAIARWNRIAKPIHSLGLLEDAIVKIAGIQQQAEHVNIEKPALVIMCGDHGVVAEHVTQTGAEVTRVVSENFATGNTSAAVMAKTANVSIFPIDIGIASDGIEESQELKIGSLIDRRVRKGTGNIVVEPAMTIKECEQAIQIGIDIVKQLKERGYRLIATGEMGIGNTTPSSALASVLLEQPVEVVTGKGAGLTQFGLEQKYKVIKRAIDRYQKKYQQETCGKDASTNAEENRKQIVCLMAELGGLELAGMMGLFLGGAIYRVPVLIDGFISAVSALCAIRANPLVQSYLLASHASNEPAGMLVLKALNVVPFLKCGMCLGEGTGALTAIPILRMATAVYEEMSTFEEIEIKEYDPKLR